VVDIFEATTVIAGIVDVDASFVFQLGLFLLFFLLMNFLVIRPMLRAHQLRFSRMEGARQDAEAMDLRAARAHAEYEEKITSTRQDAVSEREAIRDKANENRRIAVDEVRTEIAAAMAKAKDARTKSVDSALAEVDAQADALADAIVARLIGGKSS
jgi:F0F1-type ATP synthase membrane subunit b/b'